MGSARSRSRSAAPAPQALMVRPRGPYDPEARVVAVTGAYSFLGAELVRRLERDHRIYKVLALDVKRPPWAAGALGRHGRATAPSHKTQHHAIDLTAPTIDGQLAALFHKEGVDTVVHAARLSQPSHRSEWAHELEVIGTLKLLNACAAHRPRKLVVWSQTLVYGARPENPNFLAERHPLDGARSPSHYVRDLVDVERQVRRFRDEAPEVRVTTLRTAAILGPTIRNWATRFFSHLVLPSMMGYDPLVQVLHEEDAVTALELAALHDAPGELNVVGRGLLPYSSVLARMGRLPLPLPHPLAYGLGRVLWAAQLIDVPPTFLDLLRYLCIADGARAERELGFRPRHDIGATIDDFLGVRAEAGAPLAGVT